MQLATAAQGGEAGAEAEAGSEGVPAGPAGEGSATSHWEESLVVRSWVNIEPDMEFRCFVAGGKMTAISQYRHLIHFPRLCANWSEGEGASFMQALVDAFESGIRAKLEGCFSNDDYILDLAIELAPSQTIANILSSEALSPDVVQKVWVVEVRHVESQGGEGEEGGEASKPRSLPAPHCQDSHRRENHDQQHQRHRPRHKHPPVAPPHRPRPTPHPGESVLRDNGRVLVLVGERFGPGPWA